MWQDSLKAAAAALIAILLAGCEAAYNTTRYISEQWRFRTAISDGRCKQAAGMAVTISNNSLRKDIQERQTGRAYAQVARCYQKSGDLGRYRYYVIQASDSHPAIWNGTKEQAIVNANARRRAQQRRREQIAIKNDPVLRAKIQLEQGLNRCHRRVTREFTRCNLRINHRGDIDKQRARCDRRFGRAYKRCWSSYSLKKTPDGLKADGCFVGNRREIGEYDLAVIGTNRCDSTILIPYCRQRMRSVGRVCLVKTVEPAHRAVISVTAKKEHGRWLLVCDAYTTAARRLILAWSKARREPALENRLCPDVH